MMRTLLPLTLLCSPAAAQTIPPTTLGINLTGIEYWSGVRAFSNLMAGGGWQLVTATGAWTAMPAKYLDANKNVVGLLPGEQAAHQFSLPNAAYRGLSVDIVCKWDGKGTVWIGGDIAKNLTIGANGASFTFVPRGLAAGHFLLRNMPANDPIRNIDCREKGADPAALFDPTYLAETKAYSGIHLIKWMRSAESNIAVTWADRTKPGDGVINGADSVPIEYMVALANTLHADPWFTLGMNADADYVRRFATYVRDNLDPSLKAYVENSNEVWNSVYPATWQARDEGIALKLAPANDPNTNTLRRYAQRTSEFMKIWTEVYAASPARLVRVAASQHGTYNASVILGFGDTAKYLDAYATAPYFNATLPAAVDLNTLFATFPAAIGTLMDTAVGVKAIAARYNLRYVTYEGGQHLLGDLPKLTVANRDPRMAGIYTKYLTDWRTRVGDRFTLYADYGGPSSYGAWGQRDYTGQPVAEAVKQQAVDAFIATLAPVKPSAPDLTELRAAQKALIQATDLMNVAIEKLTRSE